MQNLFYVKFTISSFVSFAEENGRMKELKVKVVHIQTSDCNILNSGWYTTIISANVAACWTRGEATSNRGLRGWEIFCWATHLGQ